MDPTIAADSLAKNPLAWIAVSALAAVAYLFRENQSLTKQLIQLIQDKDKEHRATLERVLPLAESLGEVTESTLEVLKRVSNDNQENSRSR